MTDEQRTRITGYVGKLSSVISTDKNELLDFVIDEVADRILIYLNESTLDERIERIAAKVVVSVYNQTNNSMDATGPEQVISSVSDNGQSVSYRNEIKTYLSTADDGALFSGFAQLLAPYRRPYVATS